MLQLSLLRTRSLALAQGLRPARALYCETQLKYWRAVQSALAQFLEVIRLRKRIKAASSQADEVL